MNITELLDQNLISLEMQAIEKWDAIRELSNLLIIENRIASLEDFMRDVEAREAQVSTGVGGGIAIPHAISKSVIIPSIVFGRSEKGIAYGAIDNLPVHLVFLFAIPKSYQDKEYLRTLACMARFLVHDDVREKLSKAVSFEDISSALSDD